jgi:hypothetical protein
MVPGLSVIVMEAKEPDAASVTRRREMTSIETTAFRAALQAVAAVEPRVAAAIEAELADQRESLKLIASENYASPATLLAMGN